VLPKSKPEKCSVVYGVDDEAMWVLYTRGARYAANPDGIQKTSVPPTKEYTALLLLE
jgi:hypothetical protein